MKLNLSDEPATAELLSESLGKTGSATISVNGNSMHPTLQMGWRVHLEPVRGDQLRIGEIGVFRGEHYLTIHRLIWRTRDATGEQLVFRGDYNRAREWIEPSAVIARVIAIEIPGQSRGMEKVVAVESDVLTYFYRLCHGLATLFRPLLPRRPGAGPPGRIGLLARSIFRGAERTVSIFLPGKR